MALLIYFWFLLIYSLFPLLEVGASAQQWARRDKTPPEGPPPRSRLLHSIRVEICVDVSEIRMCRFRRPLQGTSRDLANELERIRRSHPRRSPSPPSQLESMQSSSCFPRRRSSLTVRCGECRGRRTWTLCTLRGASIHVMPEGIDYGVTDDTAARGHGSFSRSTRVLWLLSSILKSNRRPMCRRPAKKSVQKVHWRRSLVHARVRTGGRAFII